MLLVFIGFVIGFASCFPPIGPITVVVLRRGLTGDYRGAFTVGIGRVLPESLYCLAAIFGVDLLISSFPQARTVLEWAGVLIITALGVYFLVAKPADEGTADAPESDTPLKDFSTGFALSILNPTLAVTWPTIIGILISVTGFQFALWQKFAFPGALAIGIVSGYTVLIGMLRRWGPKLEEHVIGTLLRLMGLSLLLLGLWYGVKLIGGS